MDAQIHGAKHKRTNPEKNTNITPANNCNNVDKK